MPLGPNTSSTRCLCHHTLGVPLLHAPGRAGIPIPIIFKSVAACCASNTNYNGLGETTDMLPLCLSMRSANYNSKQDEGSRGIGQRVRPAQQPLLCAMSKSHKGTTKHPCTLARTCPPNPIEEHNLGCAEGTTLQH